MTSKTYYIVKSSYGCLGGIGSVERLSGKYTNKKDANKVLADINKGNDDRAVNYWIDWYWNN